MTDRPIIFSAPMVRALLDGRKTQTRRVLKPQPQLNAAGLWIWPAVWSPETMRRYSRLLQTDASSLAEALTSDQARCLKYAIDDRLWVRETWLTSGKNEEGGFELWDFDIDAPAEQKIPVRRMPSLFMPRVFSRLTLIVTEVRVQRLQDISEEDAKAEGVGIDQVAELDCGDISGVRSVSTGIFCSDHRDAMRETWSKIHGPGAWDANPWVCAISFAVHSQNIDAMKEGAK